LKIFFDFLNYENSLTDISDSYITINATKITVRLVCYFVTLGYCVLKIARVSALNKALSHELSVFYYLLHYGGSFLKVVRTDSYKKTAYCLWRKTAFRPVRQRPAMMRWDIDIIFVVSGVFKTNSQLILPKNVSKKIYSWLRRLTTTTMEWGMTAPTMIYARIVDRRLCLWD
jgi:hypothetical protein